MLFYQLTLDGVTPVQPQLLPLLAFLAFFWQMHALKVLSCNKRPPICLSAPHSVQEARKLASLREPGSLGDFFSLNQISTVLFTS